MNPYIFGINKSGGYSKGMYMTTPISVSMSGPPKKPKRYFHQTNPWSNKLKT